jgi:hypothetical protein
VRRDDVAQEWKLIGEFLLELYEDADKLARYMEDQAGALAHSGLTEEQQETLLSNDLNRIRDAIREEYEKAEVIVVPLPVQFVAAS